MGQLQYHDLNAWHSLLISLSGLLISPCFDDTLVCFDRQNDVVWRKGFLSFTTRHLRSQDCRNTRGTTIISELSKLELSHLQPLIAPSFLSEFQSHSLSIQNYHRNGD